MSIPECILKKVPRILTAAIKNRTIIFNDPKNLTAGREFFKKQKILTSAPSPPARKTHPPVSSYATCELSCSVSTKAVRRWVQNSCNEIQDGPEGKVVEIDFQK
jgi:hypothetical protein